MGCICRKPQPEQIDDQEQDVNPPAIIPNVEMKQQGSSSAKLKHLEDHSLTIKEEVQEEQVDQENDSRTNKVSDGQLPSNNSGQKDQKIDQSICTYEKNLNQPKIQEFQQNKNKQHAFQPPREESGEEQEYENIRSTIINISEKNINKPSGVMPKDSASKIRQPQSSNSQRIKSQINEEFEVPAQKQSGKQEQNQSHQITGGQLEYSYQSQSLVNQELAAKNLADSQIIYQEINLNAIQDGSRFQEIQASKVQNSEYTLVLQRKINPNIEQYQNGVYLDLSSVVKYSKIVESRKKQQVRQINQSVFKVKTQNEDISTNNASSKKDSIPPSQTQIKSAQPIQQISLTSVDLTSVNGTKIKRTTSFDLSESGCELFQPDLQ